MVPPLSGTAKTHKPLPPGREYLGHPLRPVCGASQCSDGPLAWLLSEIMDRLGDRMDLQVGTLCLSTEEMLERLVRVNEKAPTMKRPTIFSTDVKALFPSLKAKKVAEVVRRRFLESDLKVEVDEGEVALYLAIKYQDRRKELEE